MRIWFTERLRVPVSWWVVGLFFPVSFVSAVALNAGPWASLVGSAITVVAIAGVLLAYGSTRVQVAADGLHAGRAFLAWDALGATVAHDRTATTQRLRTGADPAAWLLVRGYLHESVEVRVDDPDDPHPYWLVSTRRPAELVAAIEQARRDLT